DAKAYDPGPSVCGVGALTEFVEPTMTVRVNGAAAACEPTASCRPLRTLANASWTVVGSRRRVSDACSPFESVAVSVSSSHDGYSWSGAANEPEATWSTASITWVWQVDGQCWSVTVQDRPVAGSV